ncbi:MAG: murein biosynthesis integral membrane protein MurJ [Patescibacteria group bacterium]
MTIRGFFSGTIARASILLAFFTIAGKIVGLVRDRILVGQFGASTELDLYYAAFRIPDLIFNLFILGATSSAIVPIFIEHYQKDKQRAWDIAQNFLNVTFVGVCMASLVVIIFAQPLAGLIGPGFNPDQLALLAQLMRVMMVSSVVFAASTVLGSILHALQRFLAFSLAPILYNVGIILGALYVVPQMSALGQENIMGLALGVVLGSLMHLAIQAPVAYQAGFRFGTLFNISDGAFRRMITLMIPRTLALGAYNVGLTIITGIASLVGTGSITILNLATNIQFVPVSVIGISLATAVFPQLSAHASRQEIGELHKKLTYSLWTTLWMSGIVAVGIFLFRQPLIDIIFRVGAFKATDSSLTASVLGIFMFSVVAQSMMHVITRAYYALQNTRTPFLIALFSIALNVALSMLFALKYHQGVVGIAIATAIAYNINFLLLYVAFRRRYTP